MSKETATSPRHVLRFLFGLRHLSPKAAWGMIATQAVYAVLTAAIAPLFVSKLLSHIANGTATLYNSAWLLVGYVIVLILGDIIAVRVTIALAYIGESRMQASTLMRIMQNLTTKSLRFHANHMSGGIVSDTTKINGAIEKFWDSVAFNFVPIIATIVSVCIALGFVFWQFAIILAVLAIVISMIMVRSQNHIAPISRQVSRESSQMTAYFADVMANIATVKAFAGEKVERKAYGERIGAWRRSNIREMKSVLWITGSFGAMMTLLNAVAFMSAIIATEHHLADLPTTYLVISYTLSVVTQIWQVGSITRSYLRIIGDASPMIAFLEEPIELKDPERPEPSRIKDGAISFDNVSFTHAENKEELFENFHLSIQAGEKIGLVGHSGSGKTTLTRLLLRFSDIDSGQIMIDGQDITAITQADLRSSIAYVPQEPLLFHRTLRENILYGKPDASETELVDATHKAHAHEFIAKLPHGFETLVGERGVKLSGGQRQRIAIARALLKDAPILVLDEATSALDSESERLIQASLSELMKDRTSIVIAHRLSTIQKMDRIVVLENGHIIESGSHLELLEKDGTYARLWAHQSGGFIEE